MTPKFCESVVEEAAIEWLIDQGWEYVPGPELGDERHAEPEHQHRHVLLEGVLRKHLRIINPRLSDASIDEVVRRLRNLNSPNLVENNRDFHRLLTHGVPLEIRREHLTRGDTAWLIDWEDLSKNDWKVVNQLTIKGTAERRPDVVLYVNGLPLVVIELKDPTNPKAGNDRAYNQLQTYKKQIPQLFVTNEVLVVGDGVTARVGSLTAGFERFGPWRTADGVTLAGSHQSQLKVLIQGLFNRQRFLEYLRYFVLFETDDTFIKKIAAYHQVHAVNKAVEATVQATRPQGDRRIGVVWHTQGSGKSISMAFFAGKVIQALGNPTLLVVTDRNDLDGQLFSQFAAAGDLIPSPVQATSRDDLREKLSVASGGVVFSTMQKFSLTEDEKQRGDVFPVLTDRTNVVVIADEAHRTQYGFKRQVGKDGTVSLGFAANLRAAVPNASFIGFTGTPIELEDRSTPEVFGDYIDVYPISRAVEDKSTVPIYYEARLARLDLPDDEKPSVDEEFEDATEAEDDATRARLQRQWASLEALVGTKKRLKLISRDIAEHFRRRNEILRGKGIVVAMSRRVAAQLYDQFIRLHPEWHHDDASQGAIKVVMTSTPDDPALLKKHMRDKRAQKTIESRFKDPDDPLRLVIVVDMWLTGFDVPCAHTMYIDKPLKGHGLMQAVARVNRVYKDKPSGLIVDYLGVAADLKKAVKWYDRGTVQSDRAGLPVDLAFKELVKRVGIVRDLFHGFDYSGFFGDSAGGRVDALVAGADFILGLDKGKKRFREAMLALNKAASIALHLEQSRQYLDDIAFFQAVQKTIAKNTTPKGESSDALNAAIRQIVSRAVVPNGVLEVLGEAGIDKPEISVLSEEFLQTVQASPHRNLQLETLRKLLADKINALRGSNVVAARQFSDRLAEAVSRYKVRAVDAAQVVMELVELARLIREHKARGDALNLSEDELAFYDALVDKNSVREVMADDDLADIARELVESIRKTVSIDWTESEAVRAKMRTRIKRLLRRHGYPPDGRDGAVLTVIEQASVVCRDWGTDGVPRRLSMAAESAPAYAHSEQPEFAEPVHKVMSGLWLDCMQAVQEESLREVLHVFFDAELQPPEPNYSLIDRDGASHQMMLAWPSSRVAIADPGATLDAASVPEWTLFQYPFSLGRLIRELR